MNNSTLVFSIALNGYQWLYRKQLNSHKRFAQKYGYQYICVSRPFVSTLGVECCWLKLTLMREAFRAGYNNVMFLDADAFVQKSCPAISEVFSHNKYLYMAKGYSKRFNSGVIIAQNHPKTSQWLSTIINSRFNNIKAENSVGWGENGHIIEHSKNCDFISELNHKWNNTFDEQLNDFIRHQNYGPLRTSALDNFIHKVIFSLSARALSVIKVFRSHDKHTDLLDQETKKILTIYPAFSQIPLVGLKPGSKKITRFNFS
ncbi:hypothetical protein [Thalassotalea sp. PLHSN55]|uniref:hypothetical protein n=1 Tax=Thalassotalea sp. PLHSN55 TaxID=3435888 RepID=UPI003F87E9D3